MPNFSGGPGAELDPRALQAVWDAILKSRGAVPQGTPYMNPNFTTPGINPSFNPNTMTGSGEFFPGTRGALVPARPFSPPMVIDQAPSLGASAEAIPGLDGLAPALGEPASAAVARTLLQRIMGAAGPLAANAAIPYSMAKTAVPGTSIIDAAKKEYPNGMGENPIASGDYEASNLGRALAGLGDTTAPSPSDTGFDSTLKNTTSGMGHGIADLVGFLGGLPAALGDYFGKTAAEKGVGAPGGPVNLTGMGENLGQDSSPEYVIPGAGNKGDIGGALDTVMQVLAANKPQKGEIPAGLNQDLKDLSYLKALDWGLPTNGTMFARMAAGGKQADIDTALQAISGDTTYNKEMKDWLETYAKTGVDVEKQKREASAGDFKIHTTKNGFLVEMNEGGKKVLKPISANIFGPQAGDKFTVEGQKFGADNPLSDELTLLQNLSNVGLIGGVLQDKAKAMAASKVTAGITDPKMALQAQILALARLAHANPAYKAELITKFKGAIGQNPNKNPSLDVTPSAGNEQDFLSTLTQGLQ